VFFVSEWLRATETTAISFKRLCNQHFKLSHKEINLMTTSHTRQLNGVETPSGILTWSRVAIDAGNRSIAACDGLNQLKLMPSVYADLEPYDIAPVCQDSAVIEYLNDGPAASKGQRWVVGQLAADLQGKATFEQEKANLQGKLCLAAIELPKGQRQCVIQTLVVCTPNHLATDKIKVIIESLQGIHQFNRNGEDYTIHIRKVEIQPETLGAYRLAMQEGWFQYKRPNGILDLGGKTSIAQIYLSSGMFPVDGRVILPGTYALALACAKHPKLRCMDTSPDLTLIMDAIANGSFTYGSTDINFGDKFSEYRDEWLGVIRDKLKLGWAKYLPQLGEVLVVGGSAPLAKSLCATSKGRFKIAPLPQVANVKGMRCDG
jgi:hypothetical protein